MDKDVAASHLAQEDALGGRVEEAWIVLGDGTRTPEQEAQDVVPQTGKPPIEKSC